jgi:hypothetical protein
MRDDIIRKIWTIYANYLIGEELKYTVEALMALVVNGSDLPELERIFMKDVVPILHLYLRYDPMTFDIYTYQFTEETIAKDIYWAKRHPFLAKIFGGILFWFSKKDYYRDWLTLKNELITRWQEQEYGARLKE